MSTKPGRHTRTVIGSNIRPGMVPGGMMAVRTPHVASMNDVRRAANAALTRRGQAAYSGFDCRAPVRDNDAPTVLPAIDQAVPDQTASA